MEREAFDSFLRISYCTFNEPPLLNIGGRRLPRDSFFKCSQIYEYGQVPRGEIVESLMGSQQ